MNYRKEVDGLRALAVLPVIFFHADFALFPGGFVGVDIFFVISGYLITGIILREKEKDAFSLMRFYERRVRRIIPALYLVMLCCIPFAVKWMPPAQLEDFSESLIAVPLFVSNILFWSQSGYFDNAADDKPLLHTWSLAVEEQYYLIFPLFIMLFWFLGRKKLMLATTGGAAVSLLLAEYGWRHESNANFYLLPTRAWELLAGALCAFYLHDRKEGSSNLLSLTGLLAITFAVFLFSDTTPFPSLYALLPVLGAALIILYGGAGTWVGRLLSTPLLVGIGLISYSAYLWHQPLFAFARLRSHDYPSPLMMLTLCLVTFALAMLSWRYVEVPFRRRAIPERVPAGIGPKPFGRRLVFSSAASLALILVFTGAVGVQTDAYPRLSQALMSQTQRDNAELAQAAVASHPTPPMNGACRYQSDSLDGGFVSHMEKCFQIHGPATLILGDSHSGDIYHALAVSTEVPFLVGLTRGGCLPYIHNGNCQYVDFLGYLKKHPEKIANVIYKQSGAFLVMDEQGEVGRVDLFRHWRFPVYPPHSGSIDQVFAYLQGLSSHTRVIWLGPRLQPHIDIWSIIDTGCNAATLELNANLTSTFTQLDKTIAQRAIRENIPYISEIAALDFDVTRDMWDCRSVYWRDDNHWSDSGERRFGERLAPAILKSIADPGGAS